MLRRLSVALLSACASVLPAGAADLGGSLKDQPYVAPFTWTGRYFGVNLGYGWGSGHVNVDPVDATVFTYLAPARLDPDPSGWLGGGQIGYNWQTGSLVFGAEADFQGANISGSDTVYPSQVAGTTYGTAGDNISVHQKLDWFGTARLRAGITAWEARVLLYVTGGLAWGQVKGYADTDFRPSGHTEHYPVDFSDTRTGWVLGGGFEWAFNDNWSFKTEYLHMDFGSDSMTANAVGITSTNQARYHYDTDVDLVRAGLNYKIR